MGTRTIHTLAYKLLVDNSQFGKGMVASRSELSQAKRLMKEMITPAEKMEVEFAKLGKLVSKGAIDQDVYNRKKAQLRAEYNENTDAAKARRASELKLQQALERGKSITQSLRTAEEKHIDTMIEMKRLAKSNAISQSTYNRAIAKSRDTLPSVIAAKKKLAKAEKDESDRVKKLTERRNALGLAVKGGALAAVAGAFVAGGAIVNTLDQQIDRIDKLSKVSDKLGVSTEFLTRFQFAAGRISGLETDSVSKAFEKMTRRVSEAAAGGGEAVNVLKELGLNAKQLADSGPEKSMLTIARAMDKVVAEHDRIRIATKLFDDEQAGLHATLKLTNTELQNQFDLADKLRVTVSGFDASEMTRAKDAINEMNSAFEGFAAKFTTTIGPAITQVLEELNNTMANIDGQKSKTFLGRVSQSAGILGSAAVRTAANIDFNSLKNPESLITDMFSNMRETAFESALNDLTAEGNFQQKQKEAAEERKKADAARIAGMQAAKAEADKAAKVAAAAETAAANQKAREEALAKLRERSASITQKYMTTQEKIEDAKKKLHNQTVARVSNLKQMLASGNISRTTFGRAIQGIRDEQNNVFKPGEESPQETENQIQTSGPLESLAAGSSEAFKFLNQTSAVASVETELAKERTKAVTKSESHLANIVSLLDKEPESEEYVNL